MFFSPNVIVGISEPAMQLEGWGVSQLHHLNPRVLVSTSTSPLVCPAVSAVARPEWQVGPGPLSLSL